MSSAPSAPIVLSSGTDDDSLSPFSDDADVYEDLYDVDNILEESVRPVAEEHSNVPGLRLGELCIHYLVKWAGYPTSQSSWIPVPLCSKSLVLLWKQQCHRKATAAAAVEAAAAAAVASVNADDQLIHKLSAELHEMKMFPRHRCLRSLACYVCFNVTQICTGACLWLLL
jgi:hypothetical protein